MKKQRQIFLGHIKCSILRYIIFQKIEEKTSKIITIHKCFVDKK